MTYTRSTLLPVTPDEAFALVTEPERLRRWQAVTARVDLRAGGGWRWTVVPGHVAAGTVREVEPGRRVVLGWGWEGDDDLPPDASTVTLTIEPEGEGTRVTLTHEGLTPEQAARHAEGWTHYLERLELTATHGDPGPDSWAWAPDPLDEVVAGEAALGVLLDVLRRVDAVVADRPTPCTDLTCGALVEHVEAGLTTLAGMAGHVAVPGDGSWEHRVATLGEQALEAWRHRGLEGSIGEGERAMPASFAAAILPVELLLHAWDLAQGAGVELRASAELVASVHAFAEQVVPGGRGTRFAAEVEPGADADPMDRLAAYSGRSPVGA